MSRAPIFIFSQFKSKKPVATSYCRPVGLKSPKKYTSPKILINSGEKGEIEGGKSTNSDGEENQRKVLELYHLISRERRVKEYSKFWLHSFMSKRIERNNKKKKKIDQGWREDKREERKARTKVERKANEGGGRAQLLDSILNLIHTHLDLCSWKTEMFSNVKKRHWTCSASEFYNYHYLSIGVSSTVFFSSFVSVTLILCPVSVTVTFCGFFLLALAWNKIEKTYC